MEATPWTGRAVLGHLLTRRLMDMVATFWSTTYCTSLQRRARGYVGPSLGQGAAVEVRKVDQVGRRRGPVWPGHQQEEMGQCGQVGGMMGSWSRSGRAQGGGGRGQGSGRGQGWM